jgi:Holliday junction DNA helicase RuvA
MIAKLKGRVDSFGEDWAVIDVQGVGYLAWCGRRTLDALPAPGEAATLVIETVVREDAITLYGFSSDAEKAFFRLLTTVQGVGAKVALAILSVGTPDQLIQAIAAQDKALFTRASGVGPKLAGRIVAELRDKAAALAFAPTAGGLRPPAAMAGGAGPAAGGAAEGAAGDAVSALVNLGYGRAEAFAAVARVQAAAGEATAAAALIAAALKDLGRGL